MPIIMRPIKFHCRHHKCLSLKNPATELAEIWSQLHPPNDRPSHNFIHVKLFVFGEKKNIKNLKQCRKKGKT